MTTYVATLAAPSRLRDIVSLGKPRLSSLVLLSAGAGVWLAPGERAVIRSLMMLVGTALLVWAANALNCYFEQDVDGAMARTRDRALPSGRLEPWVAATVGWGVALLSMTLLALWTNPLTASLGAVGFLSYVMVYTPLKRQSSFALVVGAVSGSVPPLMGWTAVTGSLDTGGLILFAILFVWQLPHFLAISMFGGADYARAGLRVFSVVFGNRVTAVAIALSALALVVTSLLPFTHGMAGAYYAFVAAVLGVGMIYLAAPGFRRAADIAWARRVFLYSLAHLSLLIAAMIADAA